MTQQDQDDRDMAMFFADQQAFEKQAQDALQASLLRPLKPDEVAALAWAARLQTPEIRK